MISRSFYIKLEPLLLSRGEFIVIHKRTAVFTTIKVIVTAIAILILATPFSIVLQMSGVLILIIVVIAPGRTHTKTHKYTIQSPNL